MKKFFTLLIALSLIGSISFAQNPEVLDGVLKVKFKDEKTKQLDILVQKTSSKREIVADSKAGYVQTGIASIDKLNQKYGAVKYTRIFRDAGINEAKHREFGLHLWYKIEYSTKATPIELAKEFMNSDDIEHANPQYAVQQYGEDNAKTLSGEPNDPSFAAQWHYENTGQTSGTVGSDISLLDAWELETGNSNVIVAVEDGGVDWDHPDIDGNMWVNSGEIANNGVDDDNNGYVDDIYGYNFGDDTGTLEVADHGTHVAGTIAAETNNGIGVSGIAGGTGSNDGVRIMSCCVFGSSSDGFDEAFVYAADMGAVISQNSWGYTSSGTYDQSVLDGIDYFIANAGGPSEAMDGGIVIFAAGNDGSDKEWYPGYYDNVLTVAATNHNDERSYYSNYGTWVDIAAPGGELTSSNTDPTGIYSLYNGTYGYMQGTSMACPHVSGVAALIVSYNYGNITATQLRNYLVDNTDYIDNLNSSYTGKLGSGRVNAYASLVASGGTGIEDTEAPTAPTNLASASIAETSFTLSWTASTDNIAVTTYNIYQGGSLLATTSSTSYNVTGLSASTTYSYYVTAKDAAGNVSDASSTISVTTDEYVATYCDSKGSNYSYEWISKVVIGTYTNSSSAAGYTDFTSENISLEAGTTVSVALTPGFASSTYNEYWKIWIDYDNDAVFDNDELAFDAGALSKTTVTGTMNILASASGTTRMRVSMKYNASQTACETFSYGEVEDYTVTFGEAVPDTEVPTTPTSLAASSITSSSVTLSWTASTDNVAVSQYNVYKNGSLAGTATTNSYTATGLSASTSYSFYVTAEDAAGNVSSASSTVTATTSDESLTYCTSTGNNVTYEWIDLVQLNEINNTTTKNGGYADYTSLTANVSLGSSQTIYFSCGFKSSTYTEYWHVWIDWDHSGTFDTDEQMVSGSSSSSATLSGTFTVPTDAVLGTTRMRVTMKYNSAATACETFSYGEVEDYTVNVTASSFNYFFAGNSNAEIIGNVEPTNLVVYPNPAVDYVNVVINNGSAIGTISIYNVTGSLVKVVDIEGSSREINISELPIGTYIISVDNEKDPIVKQFIKR